eukprot:2922046-Pleurochrysis_carterae.AAC.1
MRASACPHVRARACTRPHVGLRAYARKEWGAKCIEGKIWVAGTRPALRELVQRKIGDIADASGVRMSRHQPRRVFVPGVGGGSGCEG